MEKYYFYFNFTKRNTPPWVFFHVFWIVQMVPNRAITKLEWTLNYPANIFLIKINNKNTRKRWEVCSKH